MYKNVEVLDNNQHRDIKINEIKDFHYAAQQRECVITHLEFFECAKSLPIVFTKNSDDKFVAVAVMGIHNQSNQFIDKQGNWRLGVYIPAYIKRYPFIFISAQNGSLALGLDMNSSCISKGNSGQPLFEQEGKISEFSQNVLNYMSEFQLANTNTQDFILKLDSLGLLEPAQANYTLESQNITFAGFYRINEKKLSQLDDTNTLALVKSGYYKLAICHLMSLSNFVQLGK